MLWCVVTVVATVFSHWSHVEACTLIVAGKNTTLDGSTMVAHTDDAGGSAADIRLVRVPAMTHEPNTSRPVYLFQGGFPRLVSHERGPLYAPTAAAEAAATVQSPSPGLSSAQYNDPTISSPKDSYSLPSALPLSEILGHIPHVPATYGYFDQDYGMMNEVQLAIGESTCASRTVGWPRSIAAAGYGFNLFGIAELSKIALERCDSARCAIDTMGHLATTYGFYSEDSGSPASPDYSDSAETVGIADKYGEVWIFHVLTGVGNASAIWGAARVPDDHVAVVANGFTIRTMNVSDTDHYRLSPHARTIAQDMGWWDPQAGPFDFTAAFGYLPKGPLLPLYVGRRMWRVFDLVAPSLQLDATLGQLPTIPTYPFSVASEVTMSPSTLFNILMDHYEGTPYDMTVGLAAGPFHSPVRFDGSSKNVTGGWERAISMFRTLYSFVLVSDGAYPDPLGGTVWYGQSSPHGSVYVPFSCAQTSVPASYLLGKESRFTTASAWWAFDFVNNWSLLRYSIIAPDIKAAQATIQAQALTHHASTRHTMWEALTNTAVAEDNTTSTTRMMTTTSEMILPPASLRSLEDANNAFASLVIAKWWQLAWQLVSKFSDGYVTTGEGATDMMSLGYPQWWLETTSFASWPGTSYRPPSSLSGIPSTPEVPVVPGGTAPTIAEPEPRVRASPPSLPQKAVDPSRVSSTSENKQVPVTDGSLHVPSFLVGLFLPLLMGMAGGLYHRYGRVKRSSGYEQL